MRRVTGGRASLRLPIAVVLLALPQAATGAGMPVAPGDVLRVSIAEAPAMNREAKVDADGQIRLPQIGGVTVAGSDLDTIRRKIEMSLALQEIIRLPTVLVEIASYRPFYVGGVVATPGAVDFEPGLTVRHALILAGGVDRGTGAERLSAAELVDLRAKWRTTSYALLQIRSQVVRLQAELAGAPAPDFSDVETGGMKGADVDAVLAIENGIFDAHKERKAADEDHLKDVLDLIDLELDVLTRQGTLDAEGRELQREQVENARALVAKGVIPLPRLQELEREASRLSRDVLETQSFAARARQLRETKQYEASSSDSILRLALREELRGAMAELARLEAEREVVASALASAGLTLAAHDAPQDDPIITIYRSSESGTETIAATLETAIRPGDVLEVAFAAEPQG